MTSAGAVVLVVVIVVVIVVVVIPPYGSMGGYLVYSAFVCTVTDF